MITNFSMKYSEFFKMLEKKDYLIKKLSSLTDEQKNIAIEFFNKHPNYENEIDWNRKDLSWDDFEAVMTKERVSKSKMDSFLKEGVHYFNLYSDEDVTIYQPLTWMGSRYIASKDVAPYVEGKWCIAYQKERSYWDDYSFGNEVDIDDYEDEDLYSEDYKEPHSFLIICTPTTKWAVQINIYSGEATFWDRHDNDWSEDGALDEIEEEVPNIRDVIGKLEDKALNNHYQVRINYDRDLKDEEELAKRKEEQRQADIKSFHKRYEKSIKKQGYYEWEGNLDNEKIEYFGFYDEASGVLDSRISNFKIKGDYKTISLDIKEVTWPKAIEGNFSVAGCEKIEEVVIPEYITEISDSSFTNCTSLKNISIHKNVTSIGDRAFRDCKSLEEIDIPYGVKSIGWSAFTICTKLKKVIIPDSVTSIGDKAFQGCLSLSSIKLPEGITDIGEYAFNMCPALSDINIPDSVTSIGDWAFAYCPSLKEIRIPNKVTTLCTRTFMDCTSLTKVYIPSSVMDIEYNVFQGCSSLEAIYIDRDKESISLRNARVPSTAKVYWKGEF